MEEEAKAALYAKIAQQQEAQLRLERELREARDYTDRESACDVIYEESRRLKTVTTMQEESRAHIIDLKLSLKYDENAKDKQELIQGWLKGLERDSRKAIREAEMRLTREHSKLRSLEEKSRKLLHSSSLCEQRAMHLKKQLAEKREDEKTAEIIERRGKEKTTEEGIMKGILKNIWKWCTSLAAAGGTFIGVLHYYHTVIVKSKAVEPAL